MRWLVTGAGGMLGHDVLARLQADRAEVVGLTHTELDVTDAAAVESAFAEHRPDVVVNCAAYTAVDDAEAHEEDALAINGDGPSLLARAAAARGSRLLHVSTDYVFAGDGTEPYAEDAKPAPRTAYGRTKLVGEEAVLDTLPTTGVVVRTAWLYGAHGSNFVRTMMRLEKERDTLDVVADQRGQPTWTADVAARLVELGDRPDAAGVFHATSAGEATWCDLAREVFQLLGADPGRVRPTTTEKFPRPAPRPAYSVLGHDRWADFGMTTARDWRDALRDAFPSLR
ncbi:dTDP-4-dehydrorhamnose reductase [Actinopolymorpha pittospori]|uniref:dTDP-4-dehydrorhamnose reductase n=1 Tax=Actinopolymorpha pittospori TaxID=648752 RepID=A0A927RPH7_9ACTN|nr:dTDP-4-dehydrorhamnose reductase [Actinopolymorpha pittospori]MBE1611163.1 dTDP-4-dehydrorhamnose reductase [Actinopolymorpha pittospori]